MKINTLFRLHLLVNLFTMMSSSMNIPWIIRASFLNQLANVNFDYFSPIPYDKTENTDDLISVTSSSNEGCSNPVSN